MRLKRIHLPRFPIPADRRAFLFFLAGFLAAAILLSAGFAGFEHSSETEFCISCHEMRVVAEQGWMYSTHVQGSAGVVAECRDCHIPPEPLPKLWTKTRDGLKDVFVHFFLTSDPSKMEWGALGASARRKISDSSCRTCHANLTPQGAPIKVIIAHRDYDRGRGGKRCLDCHTDEIHGQFKEYLGIHPVTVTTGGTR